MVRLYFKIVNLDMVRTENFKVKYRLGHVSVSISWPHHLRQNIDVGPLAGPVDSKSIVVSRKGEQVVVSMAKVAKSKWSLLSLTGNGYQDIRVDHKMRSATSKEKNMEIKPEREATKSNNLQLEGISRKALTPGRARGQEKPDECIEVYFILHQFHEDDAWVGKSSAYSSSKKTENPNYLVSNVQLPKHIPSSQEERTLSKSKSKNKVSLGSTSKLKLSNYRSEQSKPMTLPLKTSFPNNRRSIEQIIKPDSKKLLSSSKSQMTSVKEKPLQRTPLGTRKLSQSPSLSKITTPSSASRLAAQHKKQLAIENRHSPASHNKVAAMESTRDTESRGNDSILTMVSGMDIDEHLKNRLDTYAMLAIEERVALQREIIEAVSRVLREERAKRLACEQRFEQILLADSRKIGELVVSIYAGRAPQRISAP